MPFSPLCYESEAILSKKFSSQLPKLECSYEEILISVFARSRFRLIIWTHWDFYKWKSSEARSRKPSQPGRPRLFEEAHKSVFHLSSQICGSFIKALSKTALANQSKQYQLLRFSQNKNLASHKYVSVDLHVAVVLKYVFSKPGNN